MSTRLWLSIGAVVAAVAAGIYYNRSDVAAEAPILNTAEVTEGDVIATVEASGTLEAVTTVEVGTLRPASTTTEVMSRLRQAPERRPRGPRQNDTAPRGDPEAAWVLEQGALARVSVQPGISDGTQTAVVSGELTQGTRVVTGLSTPSITSAAPTTSPLLPAGRRGAGGDRR